MFYYVGFYLSDELMECLYDCYWWGVLYFLVGVWFLFKLFINGEIVKLIVKLICYCCIDSYSNYISSCWYKMIFKNFWW